MRAVFWGLSCFLALELTCVAETFVARGLVQPFQEVTVSSPVQSHVLTHHVDLGDRVEPGVLLTTLYGRPEELNMERTKAALEKREFDFQAAENLFKDRLISEDEALVARIERDLARLQHEIAVESAAQRLIKAPIGGIVVDRLVEQGETVRPADAVWVIVDIEQIFVQVFVEAERLRVLEVGQDVALRFPELDIANVSGKIDFIDPRVDPASGLLRVKILAANPRNTIKVGVRAEATFTIP